MAMLRHIIAGLMGRSLVEPFKDRKRQQLLALARSYLNASDIDHLRSKVVVDLMLEDGASIEAAEAAYEAAVRDLGKPN